eukprot:m.25069 g.25069  ORF g.25069 m.25069 type:complete len:470 (-) comp7672_c0_seq2:27-1436(-)
MSSVMSDETLPLMSDVVEPPKKQKKSNFAASCSNFSVQYNLSALSIAVTMMTSVYADSHGQHVHPEDPSYKEPKWADYTILSIVFVGMISGMSVMGYLGDFLGRQRATILTLSFTVGGALGSAVLPWGGNQSVFAVLGACRFALGIGVGGLYPLSAVKAAESSSESEDSGTRTGWAFFWQTPGSMAPYLVGWVLAQLSRMKDSTLVAITNIQFRVLLGLGAIPAAIVLYLELAEQKAEPEVVQEKSVKRMSMLEHARKNKKYLGQLIGTGGSWFLYDVSYYGTAIFQPIIIQDIFPSNSTSDTLTDAFFFQNLLVSAMGLPGSILAIMFLKRLGARNLNIYGFLCIAVGFAGMAFCFMFNVSSTIKFVLYCFVTFTLNFGPNVATFVLPATLYPKKVRSTFHGLSSGCAKLGAVVGTFLYQPISDKYGIAAVLWVQVALSIIGAIVSTVFISPNTLADEEDDENENAVN